MVHPDPAMDVHAVIFDLDGTLLNTLEDISNSANGFLEIHGFPTHESDDYRAFIGNGVEKLIMRALPKESRDGDTISVGVAQFRRIYRQNCNIHTKPYDGVPNMLDELVARGLKLAVLSNKPDEFTKQCVGNLLSDCAFDMVLGHHRDIPPKPDPAGALHIGERIGVPPESILLVGDSGVDMETAVSAHMVPVGARWGFRSVEELRTGGAKVVVDHPREIVSLLGGQPKG